LGIEIWWLNYCDKEIEKSPHSNKLSPKTMNCLLLSYDDDLKDSNNKVSMVKQINCHISQHIHYSCNIDGSHSSYNTMIWKRQRRPSIDLIVASNNRDEFVKN